MKDYLQLKTIDKQNNGIRQKWINIYKKSGEIIDFCAM